jgi:hypothetical protein
MVCELVVIEFHVTNQNCSLGHHGSSDYGLESHGLDSDGRHWEFFPHLWGPLKSPFQWLIGTHSVGDKIEHEAERSPLSGAEVKNVWSFIFTPLICIHGTKLNSWKFALESVNSLL